MVVFWTTNVFIGPFHNNATLKTTPKCSAWQQRAIIFPSGFAGQLGWLHFRLQASHGVCGCAICPFWGPGLKGRWPPGRGGGQEVARNTSKGSGAMARATSTHHRQASPMAKFILGRGRDSTHSAGGSDLTRQRHRLVLLMQRGPGIENTDSSYHIQMWVFFFFLTINVCILNSLIVSVMTQNCVVPQRAYFFKILLQISQIFMF